MLRIGLLALWVVAGTAAATVFAFTEVLQEDCTLVGCMSLVSIGADDLAYMDPHVAAVRVCVPGRCITRRRDRVVGRDFMRLPEALQHPGVVHVTATTLDAGGAVVATAAIDAQLRRNAPNGEACGPVCYSTSVRFHADGTLTTAGTARVPVAVDVIADGRAVDPRLRPGRLMEVRLRGRARRVRVGFGGTYRRALHLGFPVPGMTRTFLRVPRRLPDVGAVDVSYDTAGSRRHRRVAVRTGR